MMGGLWKRTVGLVADYLRRMLRSWVWIVLQFAGSAALIGLGLAWTRIPEKQGWQVVVTLLLPLLLAAGFLAVQAGTVRALLGTPRQEGGPRWVGFAWGAATLLAWIAVGWLLWAWLDKFDDRVMVWAGYLNSRFDPHARTHWASYAHLSRDLNWAGWLLRWVIVPGLLLPLTCSAAWGMRRLPWRRVLRVWRNWLWGLGVLGCALVGEAWPQTWFDATPHGSVHQQVTRVVWKLIAAYLLGMVCWVRLLGWMATLLTEQDGGAKKSAPAAAPVPAGLPLPENGEILSGNA